MNNKEAKKKILEALEILKQKAIDVKDDGTGGAIASIDIRAIADAVIKHSSG